MIKKKLVVGALCIGMLTITYGCGKKTETEKQEGTKNEETVSEIEYNVDDYVTLGNYMGIELEKEEAEVTEEDIELAIENILNSYPETIETEKEVIEDGDIVNMDYEGLLNDAAFEGGTAQDTNLTIGSGSFIEGFEEGLIGAKVGDELEIPLTFPEDYHSEELKGQDVVFKVKVNYIGEEKIPELTEEFIATYTGNEMTIEEFREQLKIELLEEKKTTIESNKMTTVQTAVFENSTVSEFPEGMHDNQINQAVDQAKLEAEGYGLEFAEYLTQYYGMEEADFMEQMEAYAEEYLTKLLITEAITKKEKLDLTEKEYTAAAEEYATTNQSTVEDLETQYGKDEFEDFFQWQKTWNFVLEASVEK